jgi:hypothetical protein
MGVSLKGLQRYESGVVEATIGAMSLCIYDFAGIIARVDCSIFEECMKYVETNIAPNWNPFGQSCPKLVVAMLLLLAVGLGSPAQAGLLGDVLDPIVGEEGEEGEGGLIEDILDPVLGEEGEGEDGLVNEILDPILGEEGEDDGGLIDDILEPILDGDGELLDELLEPILDGEILDELLGVLPIPILGPDAYEPDNSPLAAVWSGLRDITGLTALDILTRLQTHNFHVEGDEDWKRFYALSGQTVSVETLDLLSKSDTFISVYRQLDEGEVVSFRRRFERRGPAPLARAVRRAAHRVLLCEGSIQPQAARKQGRRDLRAGNDLQLYGDVVRHIRVKPVLHGAGE